MKIITFSTVTLVSLCIAIAASADTLEATKQKCNAEQAMAVVATKLRDSSETKEKQLALAEQKKKSDKAKYKSYKSIINEIYAHPDVGSWPYSYFRMWACYKDETHKARKDFKQVAPLLVACQSNHGKEPSPALDSCLGEVAGWNSK